MPCHCCRAEPRGLELSPASLLLEPVMPNCRLILGAEFLLNPLLGHLGRTLGLCLCLLGLAVSHSLVLLLEGQLELFLGVDVGRLELINAHRHQLPLHFGPFPRQLGVVEQLEADLIRLLDFV